MTTVITGKGKIELARLCALKGALKLEGIGLRHSSGRSVLAMVKREFGFKGTRAKVLPQLVELIHQREEDLGCARYEVHHETVCDGLTNTWSVETDGQSVPETFATIERAQAEIDDFFETIADEIASGDRGRDEGYSSNEFSIFDRTTGKYVECAPRCAHGMKLEVECARCKAPTGMQ